MGNDTSKDDKVNSRAHEARHGLLSSIRVSISQRLPQFGHQGTHAPPEAGGGLCRPKQVAEPVHEGDARETLTGNISVFLPEFPLRKFPAGQEHIEILGFVAKGSLGPIFRAKDKLTEKIYAVKVLPKSDVLKKGVLQQTKEEVLIQRQHRHAFIHHLQDCWQTQRHLFIMCDYCSTGDLYTYWQLGEHFEEDDVRLFAAELGSALGFLHDLGIIHRDIKMENILLNNQGHLRLTDFGLARRLRHGGRASTICGTIEYMAPEVLGGGPYNHAADWWSLGITLLSLATGEFPVPPEPDHSSMLEKVRECPYNVPETLSSALALMLRELLCKDPTCRLHNLERFKSQKFFRGTSFDPLLLQKSPVEIVMKLRNHPDRRAKALRGLSSPQDVFLSFDWDRTPRSPHPRSDRPASDLPPTGVDQNPGHKLPGRNSAWTPRPTWASSMEDLGASSQ